MTTIWKEIKQSLRENHRLVLLLVIESRGSSPGRPGFKMLVRDDGSLWGSVGGGALEIGMVELARQLLQGDKQVLVRYLVHEEDSDREDRSGMICSGSQRVVLLVLDQADLPEIEKLADRVEGYVEYAPSGIRYIDRKQLLHEQGLDWQGEENWRFLESLGIKETLYIFGGGHVSLALSQLMHLLGFSITVYDNRTPEVNTLLANVYADRKAIVDYEQAAKTLPEGSNVFAVIMTQGHAFDELVLRHLAAKDLAYLGMMASRKKRETLYGRLVASGLAEEALARVDSPIGIQINSRTPMEIAVSIAARIIEIRNRNA